MVPAPTALMVRIPMVLLIGRRPDPPAGPAMVWPTARFEVELTCMTIGLVNNGTPLTVVVGPDGVTVAMSRFGANRVPEEKRIPLPDWYRKAFLD